MSVHHDGLNSSETHFLKKVHAVIAGNTITSQPNVEHFAGAWL